MNKDCKNSQKTIKGKLLIKAKLTVLTGMHIGGSSAFAPIGAVDSPFIRDTLSHAPIIPGSSLKGKIRTLLAKNRAQGYILNRIEEDDEIIARNFGAAVVVRPARLQFFDLFVTQDSIRKFNDLDTDTYLGEIKFENSISRGTGIANPRQIERVPAGLEFDFKLVYNIENFSELDEDLKLLAEGLKLLQMDYLGGHGSRGYGRIKIHNYIIDGINVENININEYQNLFEGSGL